jgi:hypothetical protein
MFCVVGLFIILYKYSLSGENQMTKKEQLIDELIKFPKKFTDEKLNELFKLDEFTYKDLRPIFLRIFDLNSGAILNKSDADKGLLGMLNKRSRVKREKIFWKKINKGIYSKIILAEGDSWFEYPVFIREIIDYLNKSKKKYAIYSLAYGGDWIANVLYEQEYIEKLSLLKPDVFLVSGGGNDIVGDYRLAQLLHRRKDISIPADNKLDTLEEKREFADICFNNDFFALLRLFKLQYKLLFKSIEQNTKKFKDLRIITQGYDYAIPSSKKGFGILRPLSNCLIGNGKWLKTPLVLNGYNNSKEQISIITGMIHNFNEMLIEVGSDYKNVYHIDIRDFVDPQKGWYNELHPKSKEFKKIAKVFEKCIETENPSKKVFKVKEEFFG